MMFTLTNKKLVTLILSVTLMLTAATGICLTVQETAEEKLEKAREDLRLSLVTRNRIRNKLDSLKLSGTTSPKIIEEYETYLKNVELMVFENRRIVKKMEAAYARRTGSEHRVEPSGFDASIDTNIPEEETGDRLSVLDRELDDSLAAFDEMLLNELEFIRSKSADKMRDFALEAADAAHAAKRLEDAGAARKASGTSGTSGTSGLPEPPGADPYGETGKKEKTGQKKDSSTGASGYEGKEKRTGNKGGVAQSGKRSRGSDPQDDDIVARQLREAAIKETDPELKEKLWKKYDEYKNSTKE